MPTLSRRAFVQAAAVTGMAAALPGCVTTRSATGTAGPRSVADLIIHNAKVTTMDPALPSATAIATVAGRVLRVGDDAETLALRGPATTVIDAQGRRVIPGLNDSHLHVIRGGLNYNLELRWDGVPSLADAMRMLRDQVQRTPPGQWVRVVGGFAALQFA
ncbi:MAG: amidohydrolase family protein, partial [Phycisphaerales bacterium]|nr:amidohydrolase family protein [Phycisphaerales bacterium]